jgi:hypothetical protein
LLRIGHSTTFLGFENRVKADSMRAVQTKCGDCHVQ